MMEPCTIKKLQHGSYYLCNLWTLNFDWHPHTNIVSLSLQNLRKIEVSYWDIWSNKHSFTLFSFHSLIWLWMNWAHFKWMNTNFWMVDFCVIYFSTQYFFRGVQLDQDSDVDDVFTLWLRLWIMILRKLLNIVSRFKIWWHHHHNGNFFLHIIYAYYFF